MPITIENLSHTYQSGGPFQTHALRHVNLRIGDGEFLALIGHTGSGKSTLVQHLNGLLKPTEGRILLNDEDIHQKGYDRRRVRQQVGLVFQYPEHQLFEETVEKDIAFGPKNLGLSEDEVKDRVQKACEWVHIDFEKLGQRSVYELSGGQMRRVAIAGVLAMMPQVLVLDEPTAGLDPQGRRDILRIIQEFHALNATTVVMVSHNMDDVARLVNRIVVMHRGGVAMDGVPEEVFAQGETLRAIGLDVPEAVRLADALRAKGFAIPQSAYLPETVQQAIQDVLAEGGIPC